MVSKRPRGRIVGVKTPSWNKSWFFKTPSWNNCWFQLVSKRSRGRIGGFKTPSLKNSWFQNALVEKELVSKGPRGRIVGFETPSTTRWSVGSASSGVDGLITSSPIAWISSLCVGVWRVQQFTSFIGVFVYTFSEFVYDIVVGRCFVFTATCGFQTVCRVRRGDVYLVLGRFSILFKQILFVFGFDFT